MRDYWEESGIDKPKQYIVCAACRHHGTMLAGPRHWDGVMRGQYKQLRADLQVPHSMFEQGFLDQFGQFISRRDAYQIAKQNGQPINESRNGRAELFSEGLY